MNISQLEKLLAQREAEWLEFKENNTEQEKIGEYISALSNAACLCDQSYGFLIFGVRDADRTPVGTDFEPELTKHGNEDLMAWLLQLLSPRIDFSVETVFYQGKKLVVFVIPATSYTPVRFNGEEFIRVGSYKKKLKDFPEKERKLWAKLNASSFETGLATETLSLERALNLVDYESYFKLTKQPIPQSVDTLKDKLLQEGLLALVENGFAITNLGAILFAKNLENFPTLARKAARVILYQGKDRTHTLKEQIGQKGYAAGFVGLNSFVELLSLNRTEEISSALRTTSQKYPSIVLRELIANALIHQDFSITGTSPMIEIFENRIEISNPGAPLIDVLRFMDNQPRSRNEKLANLMRRCYICEERGSGVDKVIKSVEDDNLPAPNFIDGGTFVKVIIYEPLPLRKMEKSDKIRACYQHCCLRFESGEKMTNQSLRLRFRIDDKNYPMISRIIADAIADKKIKLADPTNKSRKHAKYVPFWA